MENILNTAYLLPLFIALAASLLIIPILIKAGIPLGLVDKPDHRKLHAMAVPAVGGIALLAGISIAVPFSGNAILFIQQQPVLIITSVLLMVIGVLDDRVNIRPLYRLLVQMLCALAIAASGIRLTSLYGFMGIEEIGTVWQYWLTVIIITGATNAFNLIDGIDGLAGGLAFINMIIMSVICIQTGNTALLSLLGIATGALAAFLKNNIHPAKLFMGDGGSLMLGFFTSATGIYLIENAHSTGYRHTSTLVIIIAALLIVPVVDSLRVYIWRVRRGESPFRADRTHLHHLFLDLGIDHKKTSLFIYFLELLIVTTGFLLSSIATFSLTILVMILVFSSVGYLLQLNSEVNKWLLKIRKMESEND